MRTVWCHFTQPDVNMVCPINMTSPLCNMSTKDALFELKRCLQVAVGFLWDIIINQVIIPGTLSV